MKERFVAQDQPEDNPGCAGADHDRTNHSGMQIRQDLFQSEQDSRQRRIEGRRDGGRRTDRNQRLNLLFTQAETAARRRCNSGADMDRGAFATESHTATQGDGRADELPNDRSNTDDAVLQDQRHARLGDPAPPGIGKILEQQPAAHQRTHQRTEDALHASGVHQNPAHALGDRHEGNDNQTDHCADDQRQQEQNLVLMLSKIDSRQASLHWSEQLVESAQTGSHHSTIVPTFAGGGR